MDRKLARFAVAALTAEGLLAQGLLVDLNTTTTGPNEGSSPAYFTALGSDALFATPFAFLRSNGTAAGTNVLLDLNDGCGTRRFKPPIYSVGNLRFFTVEDRDRGWELWRTDGTAAGTDLLADIAPGPASSIEPAWRLDFAALGATGVFVAGSPANGVELWRTDGTAAGTQLFVDLAPGAASSWPQWLTSSGGKIFFSTSGPQVWTTDGTVAGTTMLASFPPSAYLITGHLVPFVGGVVFRVDDGVHGDEMWISDGTVAGTRLLVDLAPGPQSSQQWSAFDWTTAAAGAQLFFVGDDGSGSALWVTDGTAAGTRLCSSVLRGRQIVDPVAVGSSVVFWVWSPTALRYEVWQSDGTPAGTSFVAGGTSGSGNPAGRIVPFGGGVAFPLDDPAFGKEVFHASIPAGNVRLLADVRPGPQGSNPSSLGVAGNELWWQADDGSRGMEPWIYDDTTGAVRSPDLRPAVRSSFARPLGRVGQGVLFSADDGVHGDDLWVSDGTVAGTTRVFDRSGTAPVRALGERADGVWLAMDHGVLGTELWFSDGTTRGTRLVKDLTPGSTSTAFFSSFALGDDLLFSIDVPMGPLGIVRRLFRSDGTPGGTVAVGGGDVVSPAWNGPQLLFRSSFAPSALVAMDPGWTITGLNAPWVFDGPVAAAGFVCFAAGMNGDDELWRTNGSDPTTMRIADLRPGPAGSEPRDFAALGGLVVFSCDDGVHGREPWVTDGTATGTALLADLWPGPLGSEARDFVTADDRIVFVARTPAHGAEPWVTDGTPAGTVLIQDVLPGLRSSMPCSDAILRDVNGRRFGLGRHTLLRANDGAVGFEPWITDGTPAGTMSYADLSPGPVSTDMFWRRDFVRGGDTVFLMGYDDVAGDELWTMPLSGRGLAFVDVFGRACANPGATPPRIDVEGTPQLGSRFAFRLDDRPNVNALLLLALARNDVQFGSCMMYVGAPLATVPVVTDPAGRAAHALAVPTTPALSGLPLFGQWLVVQPGGPVFGLASMSRAAFVSVGG